MSLLKIVRREIRHRLTNGEPAPIAICKNYAIIRADNGLGGCGKKQFIKFDRQTGEIPIIFSPLS